MIKNFLNPEGHHNPFSGSKVTAILLKGRIWSIGEASAKDGLRLQPVQQACLPLPLPDKQTMILWPSIRKMTNNLSEETRRGLSVKSATGVE